MAGSRFDLEAELDRLFALPPEEFVAARNAIAAHLKASGKDAEAARIKALKRPSVPAWAVNQLRFEAPRVLASLLASADRLRARSSDMPSAMQSRREAVGEARKKTAQLLTAGGHAVTPQTMQRVSSTLEALATYGNAPGRAVAGRLTEELPAPGFDEVASLGILRGAAGSPKVRGTLPLVETAPPVRVPETASAIAREKAARAKAIVAKREAEKRRKELTAAEKKAEAARRKRQELEAALANASREERKQQEAVASKRKAAEAANEEIRNLLR